VLAAAGFELLAGSGVTSFAFAAGLETEWPIARVPMRLELLGTTPTVEAMPDRVRRWAARGMLTTGYRFGTSPSIEPWIGGGVSRAAVRALDLDPAPTTACWSGLVAAGLDATRQIGRGWSLRADAGCSLFLAQEAYRIDPDGEIGRGPRVGCTLTLGAGWSVTTFR
jgi:hypothetical protein